MSCIEVEGNQIQAIVRGGVQQDVRGLWKASAAPAEKKGSTVKTCEKAKERATYYIIDSFEALVSLGLCFLLAIVPPKKINALHKCNLVSFS